MKYSEDRSLRGDRPLRSYEELQGSVPSCFPPTGVARVCLVLYCSPLDKAAIFGVERLPRIGV